MDMTRHDNKVKITSYTKIQKRHIPTDYFALQTTVKHTFYTGCNYKISRHVKCDDMPI